MTDLDVTLTVDWGAAAPYYTKVLGYSPLGLWRINDASGSGTAADSSGNGYDGTPTNVTFEGDTGPDGVSTGTFNGSSSTIDVHSAGLATAFDQNTGTLMVWIKVSGAGVWSDSTARSPATFLVDANNFVQFRKGTAAGQLEFKYVAGGTTDIVTKTSISDTDWVCLAMTWDTGADEFKAYWDGVQEGTTQTGLGTWVGSLTSAAIGSNSLGGAFWSGSEALVALWDSALTPTQIADLADVTATIDTSIASTYIESIAIISGLSDPSDIARVADIGTMTVTLKNNDRRFSPENTAGPYYGYLLPNLSVTATAVYGAESWTVFKGRTRSWRPDPDQYGGQHCTLECEDLLGFLQDTNISLPLAEDVTADYILKWVGATVFQTGRASGTITIDTVPAPGDTIVIDGVDYEFNTAIGTTKVLIGSTVAACATNLAAAINSGDGRGTLYGSVFTQHPTVRAEVSGAVVTITAIVHGAWGNAITLATTSDEYHIHADPTLTVGAILSGSYVDTHSQNGVALSLSETAGTPGYDYSFTVPGVNGTASTIKLYVNYAGGGAGHTVNVDAWNGATWDTLGTIPSSAYALRTYNLTGSHTIAGVVLFRIQHTSAGNPTHTLNIDHLWIESSLPDTVDSVTISGANLTGGVDIANDFDAGKKTFDQVGDTWTDGETSGLTAGSDLTFSEYGMLWVARDGTLTFRSKDWQFGLYTQTPVMAISDSHNIQDGALTIEDVFTRASVTFTPRAETAEQVVAKANAPIFVPGTIIAATRYNPSDLRGITANKQVTIPYVQTDTSELIGAKDLVLPLTPVTDFKVYGTKVAGVGPEVSSGGFITFACAPTATGVEVTIGNSAARHGWVHDLQIPGIGLQAFDPITIVIDDAATQALYGRREIPYTLPFTSDDNENFAIALAQHLLNANKTPRYRIKTLGFEGPITIGGVNIFALEYGDVITLSETQTAVSGHTYVLLGAQYSLIPHGLSRAQFVVRRVDDIPYWILEDASSQLGTNTYLGV